MNLHQPRLRGAVKNRHRNRQRQNTVPTGQGRTSLSSPHSCFSAQIVTKHWGQPVFKAASVHGPVGQCHCDSSLSACLLRLYYTTLLASPLARLFLRTSRQTTWQAKRHGLNVTAGGMVDYGSLAPSVLEGRFMPVKGSAPCHCYKYRACESQSSIHL